MGKTLTPPNPHESRTLELAAEVTLRAQIAIAASQRARRLKGDADEADRTAMTAAELHRSAQQRLDQHLTAADS